MKSILIDITKCTGCSDCVTACQKENKLSPEIPFRRLLSDNLSSRRYTTIIDLPQGRFARKQCMHCLEPGCVEACLVGAIKKTEEGPVVYDPGKCIGCRYCLLACPLNIPRYEWDEPLPYMRKCEMCYSRLEHNQKPACVEACTHGACLFGERDEMLAKAHDIIKQDRNKYLQHVYGQHELGGTSVLYISDVELDALGWPEKVGQKTMHSFTWPIISKTPLLAGTVATFLIGTHVVIKRRMEIADDLNNDGKTVLPDNDNEPLHNT